MIDLLKEKIKIYGPLIVILSLTVISYIVRMNGAEIHEHCIWSDDHETKDPGFINIDDKKGKCPDTLKWPNNIEFLKSDTKHKSDMWSSIFLRISNFISIVSIVILISMIIQDKNQPQGTMPPPGYGPPPQGYGPPPPLY